MNVRQKLVELFYDNNVRCDQKIEGLADDVMDLIANGVIVQDDMTELIGRGLDNIYWRIYGANKEFNEQMADYSSSSFCAGFQYAIQLAKGLLTQLPQPPKGE